MPTSFEVLYLGTLPLIDTQEGDQFVNQGAVNSWLGTYGSATDPLASTENVKDWTPGSFAGGGAQTYDLDNSQSNDSFFVDGVEQTHDATMVFTATLTYFDGTTADITAVVSQATNGDTYLMPEFSANADQAKIEAGPIQSITLNAPLYASGRPGQAHNLVADRVAADLVPCFTPGTRIATPRGEILVERLKVGDKVFTRDNGIQTIRWIGARRLDPWVLASAKDLRPVRIKAGALGSGVPERDLTVSPNHQLLVTGASLMFGENEVLVAAKHLLGRPGVSRPALSEVTYLHMMFDHHEVVLSNTAWTESFQPGAMSLSGLEADQRAEIFGLFPELQSQDGIAGYASARRVLKRHEALLLAG